MCTTLRLRRLDAAVVIDIMMSVRLCLWNLQNARAPIPNDECDLPFVRLVFEEKREKELWNVRTTRLCDRDADCSKIECN